MNIYHRGPYPNSTRDVVCVSGWHSTSDQSVEEKQMPAHIYIHMNHGPLYKALKAKERVRRCSQSFIESDAIKMYDILYFLSRDSRKHFYFLRIQLNFWSQVPMVGTTMRNS